MAKIGINWLFVFVPLSSVLSEMPGVSPVLIFFSASLAIVPIAKLLVHSTEQLARYTGEAIGGLLNATFGNAPELIIAVIALKAGLNDMVKASIIGAIMANLLLAQGLSFLFGGIKYHDQIFNQQATRVYSTMMMVAVISFVVPGAFHLAAKGSDQALNTVNIVVSVLLLVAYLLYLLFMLKTHPNYFASEVATDHKTEEKENWSLKKSLIFLVASAALAAFTSEILVAAAEGAGNALGMSQAFMGVVCLAVVGGAAEIASAVAMAGKDRMDLSIGISLGSSIQIALFLAPALVLLSYLVAPVPLSLSFDAVGLVFLLLAVIIGSMVSADGRSNWYKGAQLIIVYFMLVVMLYLLPSGNNIAQ